MRSNQIKDCRQYKKEFDVNLKKIKKIKYLLSQFTLLSLSHQVDTAVSAVITLKSSLKIHKYQILRFSED